MAPRGSPLPTSHLLPGVKLLSRDFGLPISWGTQPAHPFLQRGNGGRWFLTCWSEGGFRRLLNADFLGRGGGYLVRS